VCFKAKIGAAWYDIYLIYITVFQKASETAVKVSVWLESVFLDPVSAGKAGKWRSWFVMQAERPSVGCSNGAWEIRRN
jgi:hypothetical protein